MIQPTKRTQGMNWISQHKRLAIYLRDGLQCCYCGKNCEEAKLTLDHLKPYSKGGSNEATNLVTSCISCNSARGNKSYTVFASSTCIVKHIRKCTRRTLDISYAKELVERQGSCFKALSTIKTK
jgi:hypothetical protein